jgi:nitrate/nitrite transport system ATP-binding protein
MKRLISVEANGPSARIAEIVINAVPRPRRRHDLHRHAGYYPVRNHIIEFLIERSQRARDAPPTDPRHPPVVHPGGIATPALNLETVQ